MRSGRLSRKAVKNISEFADFFFLYYLKRKIVNASTGFETNKNHLVKFFLMKRGRYNRPFLHVSTMGVLAVGVLIGPYLADTYPVFSSQSANSLNLADAKDAQESIIVGDNVFSTNISKKPRDKIIKYTVQKGDTLSSIAVKFQVSSDTIKWQNDLLSDTITVGDSLEIMPVTGVIHKVAKGDTVYTIAKKFDTDAQKIVDFPFNEFANPETFALVEGTMLVVPDGIQPSASSTQRGVIKQRQTQTYLAQGASSPVGGGGFANPLPGSSGISQYASWYHMALDITAAYGTPIVAANTGRVSAVILGGWDGGYGNNVYIDGDNGYQTHYAHLMSSNVSAGDSVVAGRTIIGWVGLTGRTTGAHLHFEIRRGGALLNPLSFL